MRTTTPIQLLLNDVFQVKATGKIFQITYMDNNKVEFVNIDDREKINTVTFNQLQKAYDGGQFNLIATDLLSKCKTPKIR